MSYIIKIRRDIINKEVFKIIELISKKLLTSNSNLLKLRKTSLNRDDNDDKKRGSNNERVDFELKFNS